MNIYIPIEIKIRELEGRTLLALAAAERGHTVILGEKKDTIALAARGLLPPGLVHMKSITPHESMLNTLSALKEHGHHITVQDEESGLLDETYDTFARLRFSEKTLSFADRIMAWGDYDAYSLKQIYPDFEEKVVVTGSPRVDFWRRDFAGYFRTSEFHNGFRGKPYLLVVSNFGSVLNENRFVNVMARLRNAGYFEREEGREFHEYENAAYQIRLIGEFVKMIRNLAESYPEMNIVVRPHPVESVDGWEKLIGGGYENIHVVRDGTISRWIRNSRTIIHNGCTSALEAAAAGVHRIAYRPIPHHIERDIPNRASMNVFSLEELKTAIDSILEGKRPEGAGDVQAKTEEVLLPRFVNLEGSLAADRITDEWDAIATQSGRSGSRPEELLAINREESIPLSQKIKRGLVKIRDAVLPKHETDEKPPTLLRTGFKFPDFREEELSSLLKSMQTLRSRFGSVSYTRFGEKSYIVYPANRRK